MTTSQTTEPVGQASLEKPAGDTGVRASESVEDIDPWRRTGRRGVLLAGAGVMVLVAAVMVLRGGTPPAPSAGPTAVAPPTAVSAQAPTAQAPTPPTTTTTPPKTTPSVDPGSATAPKTAASTSPVPPSLTTITVLNNSRITGLASQTAEVLRDRGWAVASIGNYTGRVPVTSVYYPAGAEVEAHALADAFPGVTQVLPRFEGLPGDGVTMVVTGDLPAP